MKHPYHTLNERMQARYGKKIRKICVDGGFTCPNRDGTCGTGGCIFCGSRGAGEQLNPTRTIREQVEEAMRHRPGHEWIVYFQNFTNTYAPLSVLKDRYDAALIDDCIRVLDIGTRPDCITDEIAKMLAKYAKEREVWVELGLQTANDLTAERINRGYPLSVFQDAVRILKDHGLPVIAHIILGLPGESLTDIRHTTDILNAYGIDGVKIHSLFIMKNTKLADLYQSGMFIPISMQTYISWAIDTLTRLSPDMIIHRMTGNCLREELLAPEWIMDRDRILCTIDRMMYAQGLTQGCRYAQACFT